MPSGDTGTAGCRRGRRKRVFGQKATKSISVRESCHFKPKLKSRNNTWHPLSSRQDARQSSPRHLPVPPALQGSSQPGMDVAVPSAFTPLRVFSCILEGSWSTTGTWWSSTPLNLYNWAVTKTTLQDLTRLLGKRKAAEKMQTNRGRQ